MQNRRASIAGFVPIAIAAALSVALLFGVFGWHLAANTPQKSGPVTAVTEISGSVGAPDSDGDGSPDWQEALLGTDAHDANSRSTTTPSSLSAVASAIASTTDSSPLAHATEALWNTVAAGYLSLAQTNSYTTDRGERLGETIASSLQAPVSYVRHVASSLIIDQDSSAKRAAKYAAAMHTAVAALSKNTSGPAFELFGRFVESGDEYALAQLSTQAKNYRAAEAAVLRVSVPKDAVQLHLALLDAFDYYAATEEAMASYAHDDVAKIALLKTYNDAEASLVHAFTALSQYYEDKNVPHE